MISQQSPAIVILGQNSVPIARQIITVLPGATLYGLANRTSNPDISFNDFGSTVRSLFSNGTPIIGICAAGILIRTLAPLLTNKWQEPPVLAIAEDGSAVIPLLGGLNGANNLARQIAAAFNIKPAIATTGDIRLGTALLSPPPGYRLANPDDAKTFISDLLSGAKLRLDGDASWLRESQLPIAEDGLLTIQVTEHSVTPARDSLVYHPAVLAIGFSGTDAIATPENAVLAVQQLLADANLATAAIAGVFALDTDAGDPRINAIARTFNVPARFFSVTDFETTNNFAEAVALNAVGPSGQLLVSNDTFAIAIAPQPIDATSLGRSQGRLAIVGTGPGSPDWMSPEVRSILTSVTDWVGYKTYLDLVEPLRSPHITRHESDNREEIDRARMALDLAATGRSVAVVSSGDPGIYAMAAAVFEVLERENKLEWSRIEIQVCPGISAMQAAAAEVGAPLGHDFCTISLSDILKPWEAIAQRIAAAAQADFAIAFYNPASKHRTWQLAKAKEILLEWRSPETPVVIARNLGRPGKAIAIKSLGELLPEDADMRSLLLIGSSKTRIIHHPHKTWVYTPRQYQE